MVGRDLFVRARGETRKRSLRVAAVGFPRSVTVFSDSITTTIRGVQYTLSLLLLRTADGVGNATRFNDRARNALAIACVGGTRRERASLRPVFNRRPRAKTGGGDEKRFSTASSVAADAVRFSVHRGSRRESYHLNDRCPEGFVCHVDSTRRRRRRRWILDVRRTSVQ